MEDESLKMIPTSYRTKIPHALSYCCSAKMLSLAWQNVPQFNNFDLLFVCDVPRELHKNRGVRYVLNVGYNRMRPTSIPRIWEERENGRYMWNIRVGVCRNEDVHEVRDWLNSTGLEQARVWLGQNNRGGGWSVSFDEDSRAFRVSHT